MRLLNHKVLEQLKAKGWGEKHIDTHRFQERGIIIFISDEGVLVKALLEAQNIK